MTCKVYYIKGPIGRQLLVEEGRGLSYFTSFFVTSRSKNAKIETD